MNAKYEVSLGSFVSKVEAINNRKIYMYTKHSICGHKITLTCPILLQIVVQESNGPLDTKKSIFQ